MSVRAAQWRSKPSQEFQQLSEQLSHQNGTAFYLLQRLGPASFIIGQSTDDGHADAEFKVTLGNTPSCSCLSRSLSGVQQPCIHLLFVLVRIFRLAANNPLLWQSALTDRELQQILDGGLSCFGHQSGTVNRSMQAQSLGASSSGAGSVQRRPVEEDEPCPICYEALSAVSPDWLVWCSSSCGRSIHGKCMRIWSDHQTKILKQEITCPLCRCSWGPFYWRPPPTPAVASSASKATVARPHHRGVECAACHQHPLEGARYRCISCDSYDLCSTCFSSGQHLQHRFVCRQTSAAEEVIAERPVQGAAGILQYGRCFSGLGVVADKSCSLGNTCNSDSLLHTHRVADLCTSHMEQLGCGRGSPGLPCLNGQRAGGSSSNSGAEARGGIPPTSAGMHVPRHRHQQQHPDQQSRSAAKHVKQLQLGEHELFVGPAAAVGVSRQQQHLQHGNMSVSHKLAAKVKSPRNAGDADDAGAVARELELQPLAINCSNTCTATRPLVSNSQPANGTMPKPQRARGPARQLQQGFAFGPVCSLGVCGTGVAISDRTTGFSQATAVLAHAESL